MIINRVSLNDLKGCRAIQKSANNMTLGMDYNRELDALQFMGLQKRIQEGKVKRVKKHLGDAVELNNVADAAKILDYFGIGYQQTRDGFIKVTGDYPYSYKSRKTKENKKKPSDYGIDENRLFEFIKKIDGSVYFDDTNVTNTGSLESVGLNLWIEGSGVCEMPELKYVGRDLYAPDTKNIKTLGGIEYVGGTLIVTDSEIEDFGKIKYVGQNVRAGGSKVKNLGLIETIGGSVDMADFESEDISNLKHVGGNISFSYSKVKSADTLVYVGSDAIFENSEVQSAKNLSFVKGKLKLANSKIKEFPRLTYVGDDLDAENSNLWLAMALSYVGRNLKLGNAPSPDLRSLKYVGGDIIGLKHSGMKKWLFDRTFICGDYKKEAASLGDLEFNKMELF